MQLPHTDRPSEKAVLAYRNAFLYAVRVYNENPSRTTLRNAENLRSMYRDACRRRYALQRTEG